MKFHDAIYATSTDALLRPGIILGSSLVRNGRDDTTKDLLRITSSVILVTDHQGTPFVTVATGGFRNDGVIYHPSARAGQVIGFIVRLLSGTGIFVRQRSRDVSPRTFCCTEYSTVSSHIQ